MYVNLLKLSFINVFTIIIIIDAANGDGLSRLQVYESQILLIAFKKVCISPFTYHLDPTPLLQPVSPLMIDAYSDCDLPEVYDNMIQSDHWYHLCCCVGVRNHSLMSIYCFHYSLTVSTNCNYKFIRRYNYETKMVIEGGIKLQPWE